MGCLFAVAFCDAVMGSSYSYARG